MKKPSLPVLFAVFMLLATFQCLYQSHASVFHSRLRFAHSFPRYQITVDPHYKKDSYCFTADFVYFSSFFRLLKVIPPKKKVNIRFLSNFQKLLSIVKYKIKRIRPHVRLREIIVSSYPMIPFA